MQLDRPEAYGAVFMSRQPISLNFAVSARVRGPLTEEQLRAGLARLGRRHPLLAVRAVERPDGSAFFTDEDLPPTPLVIVERHHDDDWVAATERDIQRPSAYLTEQMLRCVWIRGGDVHDLILVCDHLVADGKAAIYALRDLMMLLADPALVMEPLFTVPLPQLVPPDVLEEIREDLAKLPPEPDGPGPDGEDPNAIPVVTDPVCFVPYSLEANETAALVSRCRAEGVTVQAALCAAFLTPYAERQPSQTLRKAEIPVDLRGRIVRPIGDAYDCIIGLTKIDVSCDPAGSLWDSARSASAALARIRPRDVFATPQVTISIIGRVPHAPWRIDYDVSISNLGRLDIPESYGPLRLESVYGPIFPATGLDHRILGVSTFAGRIRFTYSTRGTSAAPLVERGLELLRSMIA